MLFNSIDYLVFFPIVVLVYYLIPRKVRHVWLLVVSYYFYMCWNVKYAILMFASTVITYLSGIGIEYVRDRDSYSRVRAKLIVAASFVSNLGILVLFKYFAWILDNLNNIFHTSVSLPFSLLLPVGISFYTFQALSYTCDVYRGDVKAETNPVCYALFVSFFPQLVAGPIERTGRLLPQIKELGKGSFSWENMRDGLCLMLYGMFLKIVIADRAANLVDGIFDHYRDFGFIELAIAAVMFAFQILCDFNGYTIIARGSAQILGIQLSDNFRQPYLATSIHDFWRRWHMSLTSWFTDYLYIPLGGSRKGQLRKLLNTMIVFLTSGLWHGASWHFVAWGMLHGIYQNVDTLLRSGKREKADSSGRGRLPGIVKLIGTFIFVDIAWVFFRAPSCSAAIGIFRQMAKSFRGDGLSGVGIEWYDWLILLTALLIMIIVDIVHEKKVIEIRKMIYKRRVGVRWLIYLAAVWCIILFGIYGAEYDASQFIYFQF
ncbi:MAG: MBOAT family protein [Lachnospiraceae bacterium]|nr:MBOAT family protein [Lachnospiraceae bacterium]